MKTRTWVGWLAVFVLLGFEIWAALNGYVTPWLISMYVLGALGILILGLWLVYEHNKNNQKVYILGDDGKEYSLLVDGDAFGHEWTVAKKKCLNCGKKRRSYTFERAQRAVFYCIECAVDLRLLPEYREYYNKHGGTPKIIWDVRKLRSKKENEAIDRAIR